jgi:hypothetical protein
MNLGLVCQAEAGLRACLQLSLELQALGASVTLFTAEIPAPAMARDVPVIPLPPLVAASSELLMGLDAAGVFLEGAEMAAFRHVHGNAARLMGRAPVPLFTGPIRPLCGDALASDLLARLGYDLICLQGEAQQLELSWLLQGSRHHQQPHELIGLWCLPTQAIEVSPTAERVVLVLDQATIPPSPFANGVLYQRLRTIAQENPHWQVRLQPDTQLCTSTPEDPASWPETSLAWHHHQDGQPPTNLQLGLADDLPQALIQATACLGIASDWLLTAMVWGKPTAILGDYGIRTDFNGPLFFGSGAMHRLADCLPLDRLLELPRPNVQWLADRGWAIPDGASRLLRRLQELAR